MNLRSRMLIAGGLSGVLLAGAAGYIRVAGHRRTAVAGAAAGRVDATPGDRVLFRSTAADSYGRVATVERRAPAGPRTVSGVSCDRVYAAASSVICLRPDGPLATYQLAVLDGRLRQRAAYPLVGVPNRARVSPSGHLLAWTVFVTGDSYNGGRFSTRAGMLDVATGETVDTLETFAITRDGRPYRNADVNFWGVTFADDRRFYATMSTAGRRYLARRRHRHVHDPPGTPRGRRVVGAASGLGAPGMLIPDAESPAALQLARIRARRSWTDGRPFTGDSRLLRATTSPRSSGVGQGLGRASASTRRRAEPARFQRSASASSASGSLGAVGIAGSKSGSLTSSATRHTGSAASR